MIGLPMVNDGANGYLVYRGPSLLTGRQIVSVMTGLRPKGIANEKTGEMVQVYFLSDTGLSPLESAKRGHDADVCGDCKARPFMDDGWCYVNLIQGPGAVYGKVAAGGYEEIWPSEASELCRGRTVRLGSYGDPASVPLSLLEALVCVSDGWTGYTHAWRQKRVQPYKKLLMASVDSPREFEEAQAKGWRTFRTKYAWERKLDREAKCPASEEAGKKLTCEKCLVCCGTSRDIKSIAIDVHGLRWKKARYDQFRIGESRRAK